MWRQCRGCIKTKYILGLASLLVLVTFFITKCRLLRSLCISGIGIEVAHRFGLCLAQFSMLQIIVMKIFWNSFFAFIWRLMGYLSIMVGRNIMIIRFLFLLWIWNDKMRLNWGRVFRRYLTSCTYVHKYGSTELLAIFMVSFFENL